MDPVPFAFASHPWLQVPLLGNPVRAYVFSLVFILAGLLVVWVVNRVVIRTLSRIAKRTESTLDDFLIHTVQRHALPAIYALVIYTGLRDLAMKPALAKGLQAVVTVLVTIQVVRMATSILQEMIERSMARRADTTSAAELEKKSVRGVLIVVKTFAWVLAFVLVLDNLGIRVSTFVAGLGIGGIAIALAAQAILGDLFSYFVIFFDRPFQVGHFIKIGDFLGEVESIGIKTTRLRSLSGEVIVMSNKYLTDNQVQNFRLMKRRRMLMNFELEYGTPNAVLREIPGMVKSILDDLPQVTFDRCHLREFAASGLRYETVFFVEVPEFGVSADLLQELNLRLKEALEERRVAFAFPTRTVHLASGRNAEAGQPAGAGAPS